MEAQFAEQMALAVQRAEAGQSGGGDAGKPGGAEGDDPEAQPGDSISLVAASASAEGPARAAAARPAALQARDNLYFAAMLHVLLRHNVDLWTARLCMCMCMSCHD